jgi:hypothetical protein
MHGRIGEMDMGGEAGKSNSQRRPFSTEMYVYTLQVMYATVIRAYCIYTMLKCGWSLGGTKVSLKLASIRTYIYRQVY